MKKLILLSISVLIVASMKGQASDRFTYITTIGTGISMSKPSSTPFTWQVAGHYNFSNRLSAGIGTGLSFYEKALIPVFADARFLLGAPRKFTPYLQCGVGYAFAPDKHANGGCFISPSVGIQYAIHGRTKLALGIGYEIQNLERLKEHEDRYSKTAFKEELHHNSISIKLGLMF